MRYRLVVLLSLVAWLAAAAAGHAAPTAPSPEVTQALADLLGEDADRREAAVTVLGQARDPKWLQFLGTLRDGGVYARTRAGKTELVVGGTKATRGDQDVIDIVGAYDREPLGTVPLADLKEVPADRELASSSRRKEAHSSESEIRNPKSEMEPDGFVDACAVTDIPEKRARIVCLSGERVAVFKYDSKISALSNVCQHQNGPLGEGKILDGCITCPWHGYQYLPETGASPPPFVEKVPTFNVRVKNGRVFVHPKPNPPGTRAEPALIEPDLRSSRREEALSSASKE